MEPEIYVMLATQPETLFCSKSEVFPKPPLSEKAILGSVKACPFVGLICSMRVLDQGQKQNPKSMCGLA